MLDLLIKGGRIVDGTGNLWFRGDVGVSDGQIVAVGWNLPAHAERVIEANDLIVAPGFIDIHSHSDYSLLIDGRATSKIMQGVTTECNGNCGVSAAPAPGYEPYYGPLDPSTTTGLVCDWESYDEYQARLARQGVAVNTGGLIGHGNIRHAVMKYEDRPPTPSEMNEMKRLIAEAMEQGAFGMSSGLMYTPGSYATTEELVELCKVVASYGGIYTSHIRGMNETMVEAVAEAIDIGRRSGAPAHISHLNPAPPMFGLTVQLLQMIDEARAEGIDVTTDVMPYTIGSTALKAMCPPWAEEGGVEKFLERLKDPVQREKIKEDTLTYGSVSGGSCKRVLIKQGRWDVIWLVSAEENTDLVGKSFAEIADIRGQDPFDAMLDVLWEENANCQMRAEDKDPEDIERVLRYPYAGVQSDGFAVVPEGVLGRGRHHPRLYGTFPRLLGYYVRERKVLRLEEAVRKVTSFPAQRFGVRDRGQIREGTWADLVIFDDAQIIDRSTFEDPYQYPDGIEWVIVNGQVTVERGEYHPCLAGQTLRHG
jgi:N-acyl-D-amino-acid deacylase